MELPTEVMDVMLDALKSHAKEANKVFHQYAGYHDNFVLYRVIFRTQFKGGTVFDAGDYVIGQPEAKTTPYPIFPEGTIIAYNHSNGFHVSFPATHLEKM